MHHPAAAGLKNDFSELLMYFAVQIKLLCSPFRVKAASEPQKVPFFCLYLDRLYELLYN
jgi:hypothetical protein